MLHVERLKPVAHRVEKREAFHLRKTAEIDVGSATLHIHHSLNRLFEFLHFFVLGVGVENVLQGVFLDFLDAAPRKADVLILDDGRDDVALDGFVVAVGIHTEENLLLKVGEFLARLLVGAKLLDELVVFGENLAEILVGQGKGEADQRPLAQGFVGGTAIDLEEHFEFPDVGDGHRREHHRAQQKCSVAAVDGRREQQVGVERFFARTPLFRRQKGVENLVHLLQMLVVKGFQARFRRFFGLQREHREVLHVTFEPSAHGFVVVRQVGIRLRSGSESAVCRLQFRQFKVAEQLRHTTQ